jgi:Hsp20/alpha crystallin family
MDQENSVHLLVDIPGIKGKDLLVRIDGGVLRIEGSRMLTSGESTKKFKFSKNFLIDDSLDVTNLKAVLEKGVLTIEVQKKGRPVLAEVSDNPIDDKPDSTEEESSRKTLKRASNLCPTIFFAS